MAGNFTHQTLSVDYFSLGRRKSELQTNNIQSSTAWDQSPYSDPTIQSPSSDESLTVSPVSPYTLPFSRGGYTLPAQQAGAEQKRDLPSLYDSSFEDWMGWEDSASNDPYPSVKSEYINLKLEPTSPITEAMELSGGLGIHDMSAMMGNGLDDGSVAFQDSMTEEPLFQAPQDMQVQQTNDLFTNPLPWSHPQTRHRAQQSTIAYPTLSQSEAASLIATAMPTTSAAMSPTTPKQPENRRKRKSMSSTTSSSSSASSNPPPRRQSAPVKKTAHNMIEKRYRTNLNDKIAALRDSVPSLRLTEKELNGNAVMQEDLGGLEAAQKLNKATILSKATEYILFLEKRNTHLSKECQSLKDCVDAFEILLMSRSGPGGTNHPQQNHSKGRWKQQHTHASASTTNKGDCYLLCIF